jgi:predicted DNA-binding transcriptional regulator AlpA
MRYLSLREVINSTGLSRSTIQRMEAAGTFPRRQRISPGRIAYLEAEVAAWSRRVNDDRGESESPPATT